jgi:hypothetical protein
MADSTVYLSAQPPTEKLPAVSDFFFTPRSCQRLLRMNLFMDTALSTARASVSTARGTGPPPGRKCV